MHITRCIPFNGKADLDPPIFDLCDCTISLSRLLSGGQVSSPTMASASPSSYRAASTAAVSDRGGVATTTRGRVSSPAASASGAASPHHTPSNPAVVRAARPAISSSGSSTGRRVGSSRLSTSATPRPVACECCSLPFSVARHRHVCQVMHDHTFTPPYQSVQKGHLNPAVLLETT